MDEKFISYFFAGLFDGDGWLTPRKDRRSTISIGLISTKEILEFLQDLFFKKYGNKQGELKRITESETHPNVWKIAMCKDAMNFLNFCHEFSNFLP